MPEALALPCDLFLCCFRCWTIDRLNETEEGREYLADCERLKQTRPDREKLRELMGAMGVKTQNHSGR